MSTGAGSIRHIPPSANNFGKRTHMGQIMPSCAALQAPPLPMGSWEVKNRWSDVFQGPPCFFHGVSYMGRVNSPFTTNRGFMSVDALSSKKQRGKTKDVDNDGDLLTEKDLKYKPMGFGEGKTYDTSLEDELLGKIEHKKAAESSKQKADTVSTRPKSKLERSTTISGIKVWVRDLPKKRNIDRDLRSAFRHVPGLLNISPSVVGNEKTRDPICKGFGFLTFDTLDHAKSFISSFQGEPISFGKVEKQISFSVTKASSAEVISSGSKSLFEVPKLRVRDKAAATAAGSSTRPELGYSRVVEDGTTMDSTPDREPAQFFHPEVDVIQEVVEAASFEKDDKFSGEEESDDDFDTDDESEFEVSVEIGDPSAAFISRSQGVEDNKLSEAERHIEALEERIRKKLAAGDPESKKKSEKQTTKPSGFSRRKVLPKGNNLAAVIHGLKKKEREVMTGVLEKYGRGSSSIKS